MKSLLLFNEINWTSFGIVIAIMAGLALLLGGIIMLVSKFFEVKGGDPRIDEIKGHLSGANCGGCGYAGCADFAKALCEGKAEIDGCNATSKEEKIEISNILGISYSGGEDTFAVVSCNGGIRCSDKYEYQGYGDCISQQMMSGGRKACNAGCIGSSSCVNVCPADAIEVYEGVAIITPRLCVSCGQCIKTCPKKIIKRVPRSAKVYVACSSECRGKEVISACKAGCIACGLCQKNCPHDAIHIENNVPIIDYSKCVGCKKCVGVCPRKVIHTFD